MFLVEKQYDTEILTEGEGKDKALYIHGIFAQSDVNNRNKRVYPDSVLNPAAKAYMESHIATNRALGELDHPADGRSTIDATRACMLVTKLEQEGSNYIGKARILEGTPMGDVVAGLIRNGVKGGVSTRGAGTVKLNKNGINEVQPGYRLHCIDYVLNPSAPDAFVSSIVESEGFIELLSNHVMLEEFDKFLGQRKAIKAAKEGDRFAMSIDAFDKLLKSFKV